MSDFATDIKYTWQRPMLNLARRLQQVAGQDQNTDFVITVQIVVVGGVPIKYTTPSLEPLEPRAGNALAAMRRAEASSGVTEPD